MSFHELKSIQNRDISWRSKQICVSILLPKLHHCTGEVAGVGDAVVGVTAICVPGIATILPWQVLKIKKINQKKRKITHAALYTWITLLPMGRSVCDCESAKTVIPAEISCFSPGIECLISQCIYQYRYKTLIMCERKRQSLLSLLLHCWQT